MFNVFFTQLNVEWLAHWQIHVFLLKELSSCLLIVPFYPLTAVPEGLWVFTSSQHSLLPVFFLLWPLVGMKCRLIVFLICIPQMTNAFEHFYVLYIFKIKDIHCRKLKISRKSKGKKIPLCFHNLNINTVILWCSYFSCVSVGMFCENIFVNVFACVGARDKYV